MRLALKFAAALTAGTSLVLAAQAFFHVKRISQLQEREIRDDLLILGRTLSSAVGELWSVAGEDVAVAFVKRADERRERTAIELTTTDSVETAELPDEPEIERLSTTEGWHIVATAPVKVDGQTVGVLRIDRRLRNEKEYFASILSTQATTTVAGALTSGAIAILLGLWLIGRPLRSLSELAERVASGDFSRRSDFPQQDEIGKLGNELNAMTGRLLESSEKIRAERSARTQALEQLRHADRLTTVGKIASSMAHELGTPLNVVSGRAMMIASEDSVPEEARENARIIAEQAQRMTTIIRELLDFARRKPLQTEATRVRDVVEHAATLLEPICENQGVSVEIVEVRDAVADIDAGKILQVLTNLMMNALHAMPDGGTIVIRVDREHVADPGDRHATEGEFVKIHVEDDGIGIAPEKLDDIFEAFFTTKKEGKGTGLGLSVCHGLVREHGGWIEVRSEVDVGSCFTVFLPKREEA